MATPKQELTVEEYERLFKLSGWWRAALAASAVVISLFAASVYNEPPERKSTELSETGPARVKKTTTVPADPSTLVIALIGGAVALLAYAATGIKLTTFKAFGVEGSAPPPPGPGLNDLPPEKPVTPDAAKSAPSPISTTTQAAKSTATFTPERPSTPAVALHADRIAILQQRYPSLQFGEDAIHTLLLRSSWNGLRILKACQVGAHKQRPLKLREVARTGTEMSYDYAFGYFIASFSAAAFVGTGNPVSGEVFVNEVDPTLELRIDEIIEGNIRTGPTLDVIEAKRRDLSALTAYLNAL